VSQKKTFRVRALGTWLEVEVELFVPTLEEAQQENLRASFAGTITGEVPKGLVKGALFMLDSGPLSGPVVMDEPPAFHSAPATGPGMPASFVFDGIAYW
jgi:hypothetical protein